MQKFALYQRIHLWVENVVKGKSISKIADEIQTSAQRKGEHREPGEWVRKQVRQANRILGAKRPSGRPRKGGVLRQWKMTFN